MSDQKDAAPLTDKQKKFVDEYLVDLNGTQAAIRAGYSQDSARQIASENLSKPYIAAAIDAAMAESAGVTRTRIVDELAKIGFADIRQVVRWGKSPIDAESENAEPNGLGLYPVELVPSEQIGDDAAVAVSEVSLTQTGIKVKMHDKLGALEKLGKALSMYVDRHELGGVGGKELSVTIVRHGANGHAAE